MYITLKENETMQNLVDRLTETASLVYGIAPVAYWYENLYENGRIKNIRFSDHMREKLGYKSTEDFPDDLEAFKTFLHPDDVQLMLDNAIAAGTGKTDKYDLQYRIRKADGDYMWCHATGELVKDHQGKTVGMYGAFIDVTQEVNLRERQESKRRTEEIIRGFTEEYDAAYCCRTSDDSYIVLKNVNSVDSRIGQNPSGTEAVRSYVSHYVHPDDVQLFDSVFADLSDPDKGIPLGGTRSFEYRVKADGEYYWYRLTLRRVTDVEILIGFKNCDSEVIDSIATEQLIRDYDALYIADLNKGTVRPVRSSRVSAEGSIREKTDYSKLGLAFADTVAQEFRDEWVRFSDTAYMKKYMADDDHREYIYELPGAKKTMRRLSIDVLERIDGEAAVVMFSFMGIDEKRASQIELENRAKRAMSVISAMAEDFDYINSTNMSTGEITRYAASDKFYRVESKINPDIRGKDRLEVFLKTIIHPDEWERFQRLISDENLKKELAKNPVYKFECLTVSPEGKEEWYRFKFAYMPDEPDLRIMGMLNIDDNVRREQELAVAQERSKLENVEQNLKIIDGLASEYTSVYYIDLDTDGLTPYAMNEETETTFGSVFRSGITYSEAYKLYVDKLIYGEDRQMMLKAGSIKNIRDELKNKKTFITLYRSADNKYSEMKFVKVEENEDRVKAVALGFAEKDEEIRHEQQIEAERQMNFDIIEILASEYSSVYYIDLTTDGLNPYTMNASTESEFGEIFRSGIRYSEAYRLYVDELVLPEDKQMMLKAGSIGNIMQELKNKKTFLTTYRSSEGHYSEMKFVKVGDETGLPTAVALGFADKDAELRAKQEESRILQRNIDIIEILASEYTSVYYIDLTTDELDPYTMNAETESEFGQIFRSGIKYSDAYKLYVDSLVYGEDKQMMLKAGSIYNILKELENKKTFLTTYRSDNNGLPRYCEMKFVKVGDDKNPQAVALGFADKDDEIRAEMLRREKAERDMAVIAGLSDDFGCVVYTGYEDHDEVHYRFDPVFEEHIPGWSKINDFDERLDTLTRTLVHPDDRQYFYNSTRADVVKEALRNQSAYYVNFRLLVDGEIIYYQVKFARDPVSADNNVIAGFHNVDVETRREMQALDEAEAANKAKSNFLFNMSHDIRTPMNAIIGFTNMAIKYSDDPVKLKECLDKTQTASNLLLSLINSILDMSRIESGRAHLDEARGDVYLSFAAIESTMQELARSKNIDLDMKVENVTDRYVLCDFNRCNRVFINLISNAIKYTNSGGWVKVRGTQLGHAENGYGLYRYTIEDNGIGMSEEFQKHVFEEFTREKNSTVSGIQGTGLGLSVCKAFVTLMSGTIECESRQGVGSKFTVTVPFKLQQGREYHDPETKTLINADTGEEAVSLDGKVTLLVEDNEMNREIAVEILGEAGVIVEEATDGSEAVQLLHDKGPDYYDFILMDIQMPVMNGYEATREIRKMYPKSNIPIIAVSANAFEEDRRASLEAGMNAHVAKPIVIHELMHTIREFS